MINRNLKLLDCTIRDGGLTNDSQFSLETVRAVYQAACLAGTDYIELGYRNSKRILSPDKYGPWRFCDEPDLRKAVEGIEPRNTKISIMQDAHKADPEDILPCDDSVVDLIRIATYVKDIDKAILLANNATEKGYECSINIIAISQAESSQLDRVLSMIQAETNVNMVYIVDSYGSLYLDNVRFLIEKYRQHLKNKEIGVHFHNHQQLAFANTIEAIQMGVHFIDGTLFGLGRAAGNCPIELLIGYLAKSDYNLQPVLEVIQNRIIPLKKEICWGYQIPYMLTGMLNKHPKDAIEWLKEPDQKDLVGFYRAILGNG